LSFPETSNLNGSKIFKNGSKTRWISPFENHDWLVVEPPTPLKKDGVKVSWDDDIPQLNGKIKAMFQTTNQMNNLNNMGLHHEVP